MTSRTFKILVGVAALALVVALGIPSVSLAGPGPRGHGAGPHHCAGPHHGAGGFGMRLMQMADRLDLTEDQRAQVRSVLAEHRENAPDRRAEAREAREALSEVLFSDTYDEAAVRAAAEARAAAQVERAVERARMLRQIREILTPEQLDALRQMQSRRGSFQGGPGFGGGPGQGPRGFGGDCPFDSE